MMPVGEQRALMWIKRAPPIGLMRQWLLLIGILL